MAVTLEQFVENLTKSGLFSADELSAFQDNLPPDKRPNDVQGLARELIQASKLTRFQAQAVYQGKTKGLVARVWALTRAGSGYMLRDDLSRRSYRQAPHDRAPGNETADASIGKETRACPQNAIFSPWPTTVARNWTTSSILPSA